MSFHRVFRIVFMIGAIGAARTLAAQDLFYGIDSVSETLPQGSSLWPVQNLIQGPGVGFDDRAPYDKILDGSSGNWVTDACGFPCDYIETWGEPVVTFDLGRDRQLSEISFWGYASTNANGVKEFSLRFASEADGANGFGTSITYNPTFADLDIDPFIRQSLPFTQTVTARYVELTALDNFFEFPGDGSGGEIPGGDRVGMGEIAFQCQLANQEECGGGPPPPPGPEYYPITDIQSSTDFSDLWPVSNLIQGPGVGFLDREPFIKLLSGPDGNWVTEACGFPCDYYDTFDPPVLTIDLGQDQLLSQIDIWGYASTNANGVSEFSLRFATTADGPTGFGKTIAYHPTFGGLENDDTNLQSFPFSESVTARYIEFTATDNFFVFPGDGSGGETPGGDRVGLGEIAFPKLGLATPGDFDRDGDLDVDDINQLLRESAAGTNNVAFDVTQDGKVDGQDVRTWAKDLKKTWIGDADVNGEFNSGDFVQIFQAGKFEQDTEAVWSQGDWTGDLRFTTADLVAAFQDGGFERGPRQDAAAVPEPGFTLLLIPAVLLPYVVKRRSKVAPKGVW